MKKLAVSCLLLCACMGLMLTGCKKKEEVTPDTETEAVAPEETEETETEEDVAKRLKGRNLLTGEPMDEKIASKRPVAVMIGNTSDALPQYGLSAADVLYEAPVEGGTTRLLGIFQDLSDVEKIGSVRSCRHYYIYYAVEFDAIYLHYGQAIWAEDLLSKDFVDNLNGMDVKIDSLVFFRDKTRKAPHNAFATPDGIQEAISYKEYRTDYSDDFTGHFKFAKDGEKIELDSKEKAVVVKPGYTINKPWFVYDEKDGVYYRYQFKDKHIDGENNEQLSFKNIIFQYTDSTILDKNTGYLDVRTNGEGTGKYITNGKAIDITWKKEYDGAQTQYFDADGNELTLNQGKTCVCIVTASGEKNVGIYATEKEYEEAITAQ